MSKDLGGHDLEAVALNRWADIFNKNNGYGQPFNVVDEESKKIVELSTVEQWRRSMEVNFGLTFDKVELNKNEPPDCFAILKGRPFGVELVQFTDQKRRQRAGYENHHEKQLFNESQWSVGDFEQSLNKILARKGRKYAAIGLKVDVLLVQCAEPWLTSTQVKNFLPNIHIAKQDSLLSAYMIFDYEPGNAERHWPTLHLYGSIG